VETDPRRPPSNGNDAAATHQPITNARRPIAIIATIPLPSEEMMPPDFLGIGAQKAGTTWLHVHLGRHSGVWLPPEKELHFFDEKIEWRYSTLPLLLFGNRLPFVRWRRHVRRGLGPRRKNRAQPASLRWQLRYLFRRPTARWYKSLFREAGDRVSGEFTPYYATLDPPQIARAAEILPDARIIFIMRNPIERAWSAAVMRSSRAGDTDLRRHHEASFALTHSIRNTDYKRTLDNWGLHYPPDRIFVGFLEDIAREPLQLLNRILSFLGIAEDFDGKLRGAIHTGPAATMPLWAARHLAAQYADLISHLDEQYAGYASFWSYCANRLATTTTDDEFPYPFWQTALWDEWLRDGGRPPTGIQSGVLASIRRR
jgi:hypothetical protein